MYSRLKVIDQFSWQVFALWAFHASTVKHLSAVLAGFALVGSLWAAPSELNFQGVLLDSAGNGVTGTRAMTVKLYDAAIGGNLLYTEDLGNVAVNKGVYSFNFGTNGTGNAKVTETVAITDGTSTSFQKILSSTIVVTGSVTVTDGTYTWDQSNGSSDGGVKYDANYSSSLRRITVTYYGGVPVVGKTISVSYRSPSVGVESIFLEDETRWIEVSVNGSAQSPRQKLLTVPFAVKASAVSSTALKLTRKVSLPVKRFNQNGYLLNAVFPMTTSDIVGQLYNKGSTKTGVFEIPSFVKKIISIAVKYTNVSQSVTWPATSRNGSVTLTVLNSSLSPIYTITYSDVVANQTAVANCNVSIDFGSQSSLQIISSTGIYRPNQEESLGYSTIHSVDLEVETGEAVSW